MTDSRGIGVGGLASTREDYTTSRFNHYAEYTFEEEVKRTELYYYYPKNIGVSTYNSDMPIAFNIPAELELFTKLKTIRFHGDYHVINEITDAAPLAAEVWSLCNNPVHSMISQCSVKINDHTIVDSTSRPYPWKAIIENMLLHTKTYQDTIMSTDGFYKDTDQVASNTNKGFENRRLGIATGGKKGI